MTKTSVAFVLLVSALGIAAVAMLSSSRSSPAQVASGDSSTAATSSRPVIAAEPAPSPLASPPIQKTISLNPADAEWLDGIILSEQFQALLERARKDPAFAHSFARALHQCAHADRAYKSLAKGAIDPQRREVTESKLRDLDQRYAKCAGLTTEQLEQRFDLITLAARAGVLDAQKLYLTMMRAAVSSGYAIRRPNLMDEIRQNGESFTIAAAQTGDPDALMNAFMFYDQGIVVPRDSVRAYQYLAQFVRANPSASSRALLERYVSRLSPEQRRQIVGN